MGLFTINSNLNYLAKTIKKEHKFFDIEVYKRSLDNEEILYDVLNDIFIKNERNMDFNEISEIYKMIVKY